MDNQSIVSYLRSLSAQTISESNKIFQRVVGMNAILEMNVIRISINCRVTFFHEFTNIAQIHVDNQSIVSYLHSLSQFSGEGMKLN